MSPYLLKRLYEQVKRVIPARIALVDRNGKVYKGQNDFGSKTHLSLKYPINPERRSVPIEGENKLQAIPIYWEGKPFVVVVAEILDEDEQTIEVVISLAELIIQQFIYQYKPRPDAVDLLLTRMAYKPTTIDREELENQITALGYQTDMPRIALAIELVGFWDNYLQTVGQPLGDKGDLIAAKKSDISRSLNSFFTKSQDNIIGYIGNDTFLVLKDLQNTDYQRFCQLLTKHYQEITDPLKNIHIKEVTIGIGLPATTLIEILRSVQEALQVLQIGKRVLGGNKTHRFEALGVLPLILSGPGNQKLEFSQRLLGLIDDEELLTTLEAFLAEDLNLTKTAEKLDIHRNTVIYRLNKITQTLGKDPREFSDAVELHLAILFHKYFS